MARFRSASALLLFLAFAAFLFPLSAQGTCYEPLCCTYPPVTGTTHIESVSPQVALPGVTVVYIQGYCFGDPPAGSIVPPGASITLNGEAVTDIVFWTDAEIAFRHPLDAASGNLVVSSPSYGSDSTANEANCPASPPNYIPDYCGNDKVNATFTIQTVNTPGPAYSPPNMEGTESAPEYVEGTWNYDDGGETMTLTLNQLPQTNGTWPITGSEVDNIWGQYNVWGTLDQYGDLALCLAFGNQSPNGIEWLVLGSGDVTSQGLNYGVACTPGTPPVPTRDFLNGSMDSAEGPYYRWGVPPLFKSATDLPLVETAAFSNEWVTAPLSTLPTLAVFGRTFPFLDGFVGFAGRFVYEQSGGAPTDMCWYSPGDPQPEVTESTLGGGGWYVDPNGSWGGDKIGMSSQWDTDY